MNSSKSLLRHGAILSFLTLLSRITGLAREMTKAALLGTGALSDAFSVAFLVPNLFRRLFAEGSVAVAFIPVFKSCLLDDDGDNAKARMFLRCFFTFLSFCVSMAVGVGILAAPAIVRLFGNEAFDETVLLTRLMFPFLAFVSLAALFQGALNSVHVFMPAGFAPVLLNLTTIACAWALKDSAGNPARAMAIGVLAGGFLEAAVQIPFIYKNGFSIAFTGLKRAFTNENTKAVVRLIGPTVIGMAAYQLNDLVSSALARKAGVGVLSSLQYSLRLQELILGVFAVSIGTVLLPSLSEAAQKGDWKTYNKNLSVSINIISLITIPVTFFSLVCGEDLIRILFQIKNFDESSVNLTLTAFRFHIAGVFFIAVNRVLAPAFYACRDTKSPAAAGIVSFAINISAAALLVKPMRGGGIALALSLAGAVNMAALLLMLRKKHAAGVAGKKFILSSFGYMLKTAALSAFAVLPVFIGRFALAPQFAGSRATRAASCVGFALVFAAVLLTLLILTRDPCLAVIASKLKKNKSQAV
ncbi:MAG: murein biosynthesis integral membrane protein MurJ [Spirochaetaceae bacterium]|jgi:putative peptidoglycan lipid II flippase|nr:murein biosynthesis integral membrane protein MurJ [Spirochaetaceae bacterium]